MVKVSLERERERKVHLKSFYFTAIGSYSVKRLQVGTDMLLKITSLTQNFKGY